jgi:hypothetical protein
VTAGDEFGGAGIGAGTGKLDANDVHGCVPDFDHDLNVGLAHG